jgi:hypothetical protein
MAESASAHQVSPFDWKQKPIQLSERDGAVRNLCRFGEGEVSVNVIDDGVGAPTSAVEMACQRAPPGPDCK